MMHGKSFLYTMSKWRSFLMMRNATRMIGTKVKTVGKLDDIVLQALENSEYKPKHHPGRIQTPVIQLPNKLNEAISYVLRDQQLSTLIVEGESLNRYLKARHPPTPLHLHQGKGKTYCWKPIDYDAITSRKYLMGRAVPDFAVLLKIFSEMQTRLPNFKPASVFDFGSGVGTVAWAAETIWSNSLREYFGVDVSSDMNDLAELLLKGGNNGGTSTIPGTFFRQFLPASNSIKFDLVVSAFSLFELPSLNARLNTIHNLWRKTDQYLVLVEQGTNAGFKLIDEAKEFILYLSKSKKSSAYVFAPCPHEAVCPRIQHDRTPCNFEVRYLPITTGKSDCQRKEHFSYIVLGKGQRPNSLQPWPRVVRPILNRSRHTICRLCCPSGELEEIVVTASKYGRDAFQCAKKSSWGDLLPMSITKNFSTDDDNDVDVINETDDEPNAENIDEEKQHLEGNFNEQTTKKPTSFN